MFRGGRLSFKHDKKPLHSKSSAVSSVRKEELIVNDPVWCTVDDLADLEGPLLIFPFSSLSECLQISKESSLLNGVVLNTKSDAERYVIIAGTIYRDLEKNDWIPETAEQVISGHLLPTSASINGDDSLFSLKTSSGRYLSTDKFGLVTASSLAVGLSEQWKPELIADTNPQKIAFKAFHGKYLSALCDENGILKIRADSGQIEEAESFAVCCQQKLKKLRLSKLERKAALLKEGIAILDGADSDLIEAEATADAISLEEQKMKKFISWKGGKPVSDTFSSRALESTKGIASKSQLKRAKESGKLHEELLERRIKLKSDKYC